MNRGIKRIGKGLFAIFMIKLTLLVGVVIFQSCQTENSFETENNEELKDNFLAALQESKQRIEEVKSKTFRITDSEITKGEFTAKNNNEDATNWKQICLERSIQDELLVDGDSIVTSAVVNTLTDVFNLANEIGSRPVVIDGTSTPSDDINNMDTPDFGYYHTCYYFDETPIIEAMEPSIIEAKNYLHSKELTDSEIVEILDGEEEYNLVPLVAALIAEENNTSNSSVSNEALSLFITASYAQDGDSVSGRMYDCLMRSLGVTALQEAMQQGLKSDAGKRALKKAVRKIAARTLSWIGAAWAVFEFVSCMFF